MKKIIQTSFLLIALISAKAQDPNGISMPRIIPPSPASQEFQKFLGYPVTGSTGLVDISIPLYNLQLPGINIPLSLKYHSSGIKVEQSYGYLGYGWTMFPQFKITRTIMGKPDELYRTDNIKQSSDFTTQYLADIAPAADGTISGGDGSVYDGQFDIFSISLPNYNGNFILKRNGNGFTAISIPDAPLQITVTDTYLGSMEVKDDKGIRYLFNNVSGIAPVTDLMLTQIILPGSSNTINFQYVIGGNNANFLSNYSLTIWDKMTYNNNEPVTNTMSSDGIPNYTGFQLAMGISSSASFYPGYIYQYNGIPSMGAPPVYSIKSIQFSTGNIAFTYGNSGFSELQNIKVYNTAQEVLKTIAITQSPDHQLLQKVAISGEGEYNMEYNPGRFQYLYDQDRWGYYNNPRTDAALNASMIPLMKLNVTAYTGTIVTFPVQFGYANVETDTTAMKANSLEKITYPTGGWSRFYYEPNRFMHATNPSANGPSYGGGLRIRQIDTYDPVTDKTMTKSYAYGPNENGLGNLLVYPEDDSFIDESFIYAPPTLDANALGRRTTVSAHSRYRYYNLNFPVWYDNVTEYTDGGKIMYYYSYQPDQITFATHDISIEGVIGGSSTDHYVDVLQTLNNLVMGGPMLAKKQVHKAENGGFTLLQEEENGYALHATQQPIAGLIVKPMLYIYEGSTVNNRALYYPYIYPSSSLMATPYSIQPGVNELISTTRRDYSNGKVIANTTINTYDPSYLYNLTATQTTNSKNESITTNFYYPVSSSIPDLAVLSPSQQQMISTLIADNRLTARIQKSAFKNTSIPISSTLYGYKDWGNGILQPEQVYGRTGNNAYESRLHFYAYDTKGNVQTISKENDVLYNYLWGYNNTYPIAEVVGADYNTAVSFINPSILQNPASDQQLRDELNKIRTGLTGAKALVATYTYAPLVGQTSACDANNRVVFYEYDEFKRLKDIKDNEGNIIKTFDYHYKQ